MRSAVLSGLAITAFTQDNLRPGMVTLGAQQGFPPLPTLDFTLAQSEAGPGARNPAVAELSRLVSAFARDPDAKKARLDCFAL